MLYFFDVETGSRFNQLSGHLGPVLDVCWAYDESLLASCDTEVRGGGGGQRAILWGGASASALVRGTALIAAGYNNHMEESQEQQWQALTPHSWREHNYTHPSVGF